jgi:solute carrier family 8 (sodium/calcium exchanger)
LLTADETITVTAKVWNPTLANLTLMALGSSAPEILLSVIETCQSLGSKAGELGPSTIVGSAAFNLMVISAVSVVAVGPETAPNEDANGDHDPEMPPKGVKKVADTGVFAITCTASVFAYVWLYLVLEIISKNVVETWEAFLTLGFFFILVTMAFIADKYNSKKLLAKEQEIPPYSLAEIMVIISTMSHPEKL